VGPTRLPSQQGPSNERYPSLVPVASQTHPSVCKIALPNVPTDEIVSPSVPHSPVTVCLSSRIVSVGDLSKSSPTCKASSFVYISMRDSMKNIPTATIPPAQGPTSGVFDEFRGMSMYSLTRTIHAQGLISHLMGT